MAVRKLHNYICVLRFQCKLQLLAIVYHMQTSNIKTLTSAVCETAAKQGVLWEEAKAVKITDCTVFSLFQECHETYSRAKAMTNEEIDHFSKCLAAFCELLLH